MPTLAPGAPRQIDLGNPVDWGHPDNAGLSLLLLGYPNYPQVGVGLTWPDLSKKTAGGTLANNPTWTATSYGQVGVTLNGTSALVDCGFPTAIEAATVLTVACWARPDRTGRGDIVTIWETGSTQKFNLLSGVTTSRFAFYVSSGSGGTPATDGTDYTTGRWYRLVGTYDGTTVNLYRDGVLVGTASPGLTLYTGGSSRLLLGASDGAQQFQGGVAGVRIHAGFAADAGWVARDYFWAQNTQIDPRLRRFTPATRVFGGTATSPPPSGRLSRPCSLDGLGGAGQQAFNPSLGV